MPKTFIDYLQNFPDLPPAVGNDEDLAGGVWQVLQGETVLASTNVEYDLTTRKPVTVDFPWSAEKGSTVVKQFNTVDDETPPNASGLAVESMEVKDTAGGSLPTGTGSSTQVGERVVPDPEPPVEPLV